MSISPSSVKSFASAYGSCRETHSNITIAKAYMSLAGLQASPFNTSAGHANELKVKKATGLSPDGQLLFDLRN